MYATAYLRVRKSILPFYLRCLRYSSQLFSFVEKVPNLLQLSVCPCHNQRPAPLHFFRHSLDDFVITTSTVLQSRNFSRPQPFSLQQFLRDQVTQAAMADSSEKQRLSGESPRSGEAAPALPPVNAVTEKTEPAKASLHPAFYVVYVLTDMEEVQF